MNNLSVTMVMFLGSKGRNTRKRTGVFVCPQCARTYNRNDSLQRHQRYECGNLRQFPCHFCSWMSKRRSHLYDHIRNNHSKLAEGFFRDLGLNKLADKLQ